MKLNFAIKQQIKLKVVKGSSNVWFKELVHEHNTSELILTVLEKERTCLLYLQAHMHQNKGSKEHDRPKVRTKKAHVKMASVLK